MYKVQPHELVMTCYSSPHTKVFKENNEYLYTKHDADGIGMPLRNVLSEIETVVLQGTLSVTINFKIQKSCMY